MENTPPRIDDKEARAAMRAYLQRTEVRLSTIHRVAVSFISGAGLLLLLPVFFRDTISTLINIFLDNLHNVVPQWETRGLVFTLVLFGCLIYPFLLSLFIPLYALYLLLHDLVMFYLSAEMPGFKDTVAYPRFALSGVAFSEDESPEVKRAVLYHQYESEMPMSRFIIPRNEHEAEYFDAVMNDTETDFLPATRTPEALAAYGVQISTDREVLTRRFNAALGLTGLVDRDLAAEVAKNEVSLVRHAYHLRRLILRYVKSILIFIWTIVIDFSLVPFLQHDSMPVFIVLAVGYLIWSVLTPQVVKLPTRWIYEVVDKHTPNRRRRDMRILRFENNVTDLCNLAVMTSFVALIMASIAEYVG